MRYSKLFGKTVREAPSDAQAVSHKLLYQAGFIRELSAGRYEYLPLGLKVWEKMIALINKQMEKIGSQRFSIPILQPIEYWEKTNRDQAWGNELMKIKDRSGSNFALSATGEGVVTEMVKETSPSYKELPVILHQFITKLRDEKRARGGLLRTREFVMKDAYSYHTSEEDFMKTYEDFKNAYFEICRQLDLEVYSVIADSGALGGDYCHEFQVPADAGEDKIVRCKECEYAANIEKSEFERKEINKEEKLKKFKMVELPTEIAKIKQLTKHYNLSAECFIKNVVYKTSKGELVIAVVTGDLEVSKYKLEKAVGKGELEKATEKDLEKIGAKSGLVHSWGYEDFQDQIIFVVDEVIPKAKNLYGGYKTETKDPINVNYGRDFKADIVADIAEPYTGTVCRRCGGILEIIKTIEFGHIFKYDHFYTKHHDGFYVDKNGKKKLMYMGAYGIGIGRAIAIVVEKHSDEKGISWPINLAPFQVHLISLGDKKVQDKALKVYKSLCRHGVEVLWDERNDVSAGIKFNDADLIGIPIRVVISKRSLEEDGFELRLRKENKEKVFPLENMIEILEKKITSLKPKVE